MMKSLLALGALLAATVTMATGAPPAMADYCPLPMASLAPNEADPYDGFCPAGLESDNTAVCAFGDHPTNASGAEVDSDTCVGARGAKFCETSYNTSCVNTYPGEAEDACVYYTATCVDGPGENVGLVVDTVGDAIPNPVCTPSAGGTYPVCASHPVAALFP